MASLVSLELDAAVAVITTQNEVFSTDDLLGRQVTHALVVQQEILTLLVYRGQPSATLATWVAGQQVYRAAGSGTPAG